MPRPRGRAIGRFLHVLYRIKSSYYGKMPFSGRKQKIFGQIKKKIKRFSSKLANEKSIKCLSMMKWSRTFYKFKRLNALQAAFVCGVSLISCLAVSAQDTSVRAWEEDISMPTYLREAPETAPIFERDWSYQRARRSVYPYVLDDNMTRRRAGVTYHAVMMENEYIKLCIMPEIGGRLAWAVDKTNGYDIFYHQHVIKPANVGMLGAWISGGVEWNVFHHHRATTNLPVNYRIERGEDGSQTVWLGETE